MADKELIKQEIERKREDVVGAYESEDTEYGYKQCCKEILNFIDSLPEEPASEDLEEEIKNYFSGWCMRGSREQECFFQTARHFAEWQEKKMLGIAEAFYQQGRYEQEQELMKDAVEGEVIYQIGSAEIAPTDIRYKVVSDRVYIPNVKLGDKVKIIIVKEEQQ